MNVYAIDLFTDCGGGLAVVSALTRRHALRVWSSHEECEHYDTPDLEDVILVNPGTVARVITMGGHIE